MGDAEKPSKGKRAKGRAQAVVQKMLVWDERDLERKSRVAPRAVPLPLMKGLFCLCLAALKSENLTREPVVPRHNRPIV